MKKRALPALLAAAALLVTACSGGDESADPGPNETTAGGAAELSGDVVMWYPPIGGDIEREYWDGKIAEFKELHPDVNVEVEIIPWDGRGERMQTAINGRSTPDVTYALPADVYSWGSNGILTDMGPILEDQDKYLPNAIEAVTYDGTLYGAPALMGITTTIYVKPVWDAIGVEEADYPKTWEEVKEYAPQLKEAGYYVTQYDASPTMTLNGTFYPLLWSAGGTVLNEDVSAATLNGEEGVRAMEFAKWLVDGEYTPVDALTQDLPVETSPIARKEVAMLFSRSVASLTQNGLAPEELVIGQPLADAESYGYGNVGTWVLFESSENKEAAAAWINWLNTPENMNQFLPTRSQYSVRTDVTGLYEEGTLDAALEPFLSMGMTEPRSPHASEIMNIIKPHHQAILLGQKSVQEGLDDAAAEIDAVLDR